MTTELLETARQALNQHDYPLAQRQLITLVRANPRHGEAWWYLAQTFDDPQKRQDCLDRAQSNGYQAPVATPDPEPELEPLLPWEQADAWNNPSPASNVAAVANHGNFDVAQTQNNSTPINQAPANYQLPAAPPYPTLKPDDLAKVIKILKSKANRQHQIRMVSETFHCSPEHADMLLQGVAYHFPQYLRAAPVNTTRLVLEIASVIFGIVLVLAGIFLLTSESRNVRSKVAFRILLVGIFITVTTSFRLFMLVRGSAPN